MDGFVALIIRNEGLDFPFLNSSMGIEPGRIVKKGEKSKAGGVSFEDKWIYDIHFAENNFSEKVFEFINIFSERKKVFNKVKETATVEITFCIVSETGQFGYTLTAEQLKQFTSFGVNINFDLLSYGLVEKENGEMVELVDILEMAERQYTKTIREQM